MLDGSSSEASSRTRSCAGQLDAATHQRPARAGLCRTTAQSRVAPTVGGRRSPAHPTTLRRAPGHGPLRASNHHRRSTRHQKRSAPRCVRSRISSLFAMGTSRRATPSTQGENELGAVGITSSRPERSARAVHHSHVQQTRDDSTQQVRASLPWLRANEKGYARASRVSAGRTPGLVTAVVC